MSRSAQSQRQAPHDRQNNSARPSARHIAAQSPVSHTPRHAAPPAAPPRKSLASHTLRHAAGRPRAAKARAVWQPHRAPPRHENSPVSRTPHAAPPSPRLPRRREKSCQPHAAPCRRPTADRQSARRMAATPRPSPPQNTPVGRAPRPIAPPAAPPQKIRPAAPKFGSTARPRHAAGRPRAAKARAVWQPHRARPRRKILLSATRRAMPPRLPRREKHLGQPPCRAQRPSPAAKIIRQQPPFQNAHPCPYG